MATVAIAGSSGLIGSALMYALRATDHRVVRIVRELKLPVKIIGVGEKMEDLQPFDPARFVDALVPDA